MLHFCFFVLLVSGFDLACLSVPVELSDTKLTANKLTKRIQMNTQSNKQGQGQSHGKGKKKRKRSRPNKKTRERNRRKKQRLMVCMNVMFFFLVVLFELNAFFLKIVFVFFCMFDHDFENRGHLVFVN